MPVLKNKRSRKYRYSWGVKVKTCQKSQCSCKIQIPEILLKHISICTTTYYTVIVASSRTWKDKLLSLTSAVSVFSSLHHDKQRGGGRNWFVPTHTHLVMCFWERAMAYSATTVLPADVWAATNTESWASSRSTACFWKTSSSNGHWSRGGNGVVHHKVMIHTVAANKQVTLCF